MSKAQLVFRYEISVELFTQHQETGNINRGGSASKLMKMSLLRVRLTGIDLRFEL